MQHCKKKMKGGSSNSGVHHSDHATKLFTSSIIGGGGNSICKQKVSICLPIKQSQPGEYSSYLFPKKIFSSIVAMGDPHRYPSKSHDDHDIFDGQRQPPWCHHNNICSANPSKPLQELIALKDGNHGNDSSQFPPLIILREIPTRISPSAPMADIIDHHDNDDDVDRQLHQTRSLLSPTQNETNNNPLSPQPATDNFIDSTLDKINKMICSWSSHIVINHNHAITCVTPRHLSSLPMPEPLSVNNEPFDTGSKLDDLEVKAAQLH